MKNNDWKTIEHQDEENNVENLQISEQTREKLEDSTVSLFMDYYVKSLNVGIDIMMEECADDEFPADLDKRIRALIAKESAKERNAMRRRTALRVLRSAAAVVLVLLSVCSVLFMTVEAFRVPVMNFIAEKYDRYFLLRGTSKADKIPSAFNPDDPLGNILPNEFSAVEVNNNWELGLLYASYSDDNKNIYFSVEPVHNVALIDKEDAEIIPFQLNDCNAYLSREGDEIRLVWLDGTSEKVFSLCGTNVTEEYILYIAEELILLFA